LRGEGEVANADDVKGGIGVAVDPDLAEGRDAVAVHGVGADLDPLDKLGGGTGSYAKAQCVHNSLKYLFLVNVNDRYPAVGVGSPSVVDVSLVDKHIARASGRVLCVHGVVPGARGAPV
jgi:hypothetical protein